MSIGDPAAAAAAAAAQNYNYYMYLQSCNVAAQQASPAIAPSLSPPTVSTAASLVNGHNSNSNGCSSGSSSNPNGSRSTGSSITPTVQTST